MLRKWAGLIHCNVICRVMLQAELGDLQYILVLLYIRFVICLYYVLAIILWSSGQRLYLTARV